jgi:hypothetical protein
MGSYIAIGDIVSAISPTTVLALCDDENNGDIGDPAVVAVLESVIERAEAEVNSYLMRAYPKLVFPIVQSPPSTMLKQASLMFAIPYTYMRHPEYVKTYGDDVRGGTDAVNNARDFMDRLCTGRQFLFDVQAEPKPSVIGGIYVANGPRTIIDGPNGCYNGGDF